MCFVVAVVLRALECTALSVAADAVAVSALRDRCSFDFVGGRGKFGVPGVGGVRDDDYAMMMVCAEL